MRGGIEDENTRAAKASDSVEASYELNLEDLEGITGGTNSETEELYQLLKKLGFCSGKRNDTDITNAFVQYCGLRSATLNLNDFNLYVDNNGKTISHEELVEQLEDRCYRR